MTRNFPPRRHDHAQLGPGNGTASMMESTGSDVDDADGAGTGLALGAAEALWYALDGDARRQAVTVEGGLTTAVLAEGDEGEGVRREVGG
jgi:hypothetical protein